MLRDIQFSKIKSIYKTVRVEVNLHKLSISKMSKNCCSGKQFSVKGVHKEQNNRMITPPKIAYLQKD